MAKHTQFVVAAQNGKLFLDMTTEATMSLLTYGMIGDRLSDLVAELREFDEVSNPDIKRIILNLDAIRSDCDHRSMSVLIPREDIPFPGLDA